MKSTFKVQDLDELTKEINNENWTETLNRIKDRVKELEELSISEDTEHESLKEKNAMLEKENATLKENNLALFLRMNGSRNKDENDPEKQEDGEPEPDPFAAILEDLRSKFN